MNRLGALFAVFAVFSGCQRYDFERVEPSAIAVGSHGGSVRGRALKPDVMLLVDKSGSMADPADPTRPSGTTKLQDLRAAMNTFLTGNADVARFGVAFFPSDDTCGASVAIASPFPATTADDDAAASAANQAAAAAALSRIQAAQALGGTPTGRSLDFLGQAAGFDAQDGRDDLVVLLTDGLPNCNAANPNTCAGAQCRCTLTPASSCDTAKYCTLGCLDDQGATAAVTALRQRGIRTIVVGFGAETATGAASQVLGAMATAGGFPRACPKKTNAECGTGNTCDVLTGACSTSYYQANSAAELAQALADISARLPADACTWTLDVAAPVAEQLISVAVDGHPLRPGPDTWTTDGRTVTLVGAACQGLRDATRAMTVDIHTVEPL